MFVDDGISGLSTNRREGFNRMVDACLNGDIDLVLTKSISRFARNTVDTVTIIRKLKEKGIGVYFVKKEYIRTGGNPLFSRVIRLFLCRIVAYLSLKSAKRYSMISDNTKKRQEPNGSCPIKVTTSIKVDRQLLYYSCAYHRFEVDQSLMSHSLLTVSLQINHPAVLRKCLFSLNRAYH